MSGFICRPEYHPRKLSTRFVGFFTPDVLGQVSSAFASTWCMSSYPPCKGKVAQRLGELWLGSLCSVHHPCGVCAAEWPGSSLVMHMCSSIMWRRSQLAHLVLGLALLDLFARSVAPRSADHKCRDDLLRVRFATCLTISQKSNGSSPSDEDHCTTVVLLNGELCTTSPAATVGYKVPACDRVLRAVAL